MTAPVDWDRHEAEAFEDIRPDELRPGRPRRVVRQRPSRRYDSPEEMWAWHWARMRVTVAWLLIATAGTVSCTTTVIFFAELVW